MSEPQPYEQPVPHDRREPFDAVLAANQAFYRAFEERDFDAMSELWEHRDDVTCTHPGWRPLRGWAQVGGSWAALLSNSQHLQFIVTDEVPAVRGSMAWVTCEENLLDQGAAGTVAAVNLFCRSADGRWRMVGHHTSPIAG